MRHNISVSGSRKTTTILLITLISIIAGIASIQSTNAQTRKRNLRVQSPNAITGWPVSAKRFALVIGVDEYESAQINRLDGASNDAKAISEALIEYAGFPRDQVVLLTADQPAQRRPTRNNILGRLSNLCASVPKDGLLLVAFAGHGMQRGEGAYLLPLDAQLTNNVKLLEETAINVQIISNWIRQAGIGQVVLILDACRNDPSAGRSGSENPLTPAYLRAFNFDIRNREVTAFAILYASEVGHMAYEYKERKQGYFTWALVEGLKGAAAGVKGEVTLGSLKKFIEEEVPRRTLMDMGSQKQQRPFAIMEGYKADELVVAWRKPVEIEKIAESERRTESITVDITARDYQFWVSIRDNSNPELFQAYLERFPQGDYAPIARIRLAELRKQQSTADQQTGRPVNQGGSPSADKGEAAHWNLIAGGTDPQDFKTFLELYPDGQYASRARFRINELQEMSHWALIKDSSDREAFNNYLRTYPEGAYKEAAKNRLDALNASAAKPISPATEPKPSASLVDQHLKSGNRLGSEGKWVESESAFRQAVQLDPKNALCHASLGVALFRQKKVGEAIAAYRQAIKLEPLTARWHTLLAVILSDQGKAAEAEEELLAAARLDPKNALIHNNLGMVLFQQQKWRQAESAFAEAVRLDADNTQFKNNLLQAREKMKTLSLGNTKADAQAKELISPNSSPKSELQSALKKAYTLAQTNQSEESILELRKLIKASNDQCAECYEYLGRVYLMIYKYKDAVIELRKALALGSGNKASVYNMLGTALYEQGGSKLSEEAAEAFRQAIDLSGGALTRAYYNLGYTLLRLGRKEEGILALKSYLEKNPHAGDAYLIRCIIRDPSLASVPFAPLFNVTAHTTEVLSLEDFRGKVVLLDFWAAWCAPCKAEMPAVKKIWKKFAGEKFVIIGVSLDIDVKKFEAFMQKEDMQWLQYYDGQGWKNKLARMYSVHSIPHTVLIDQDGFIRAVGLRGNSLSKKVEELLKNLQNK